MNKVGVIVPTHKRPHLINRALASLAEQTVEDWHVAIIGNGMTDEEWLQYVDIPVDIEHIVAMRNYPHFANLAQACQFGLGFLMPSTQYVCVLEDDDEWNPQFIEKMTAVLDARPECAMAYCDEIEMDPDGVEVDWTDHPHMYTRDRLLAGNWIHFPVQMLRYSSMMRLGGFSWETSGAADWDIALRLSAWGIAHVRERLVTHHWLTSRYDPDPQNNCMRPELMRTANEWIKVRRQVGMYR